MNVNRVKLAYRAAYCVACTHIFSCCNGLGVGNMDILSMMVCKRTFRFLARGVCVCVFVALHVQLRGECQSFSQSRTKRSIFTQFLLLRLHTRFYCFLPLKGIVSFFSLSLSKTIFNSVAPSSHSIFFCFFEALVQVLSCPCAYQNAIFLLLQF